MPLLDDTLLVVYTENSAHLRAMPGKSGRAQLAGRP
jgi:hypothetical protein